MIRGNPREQWIPTDSNSRKNPRENESPARATGAAKWSWIIGGSVEIRSIFEPGPSPDAFPCRRTAAAHLSDTTYRTAPAHSVANGHFRWKKVMSEKIDITFIYFSFGMFTEPNYTHNDSFNSDTSIEINT
ncbi:uncharacterized protein LOC143365516 [Halictus rubicundus]|uniref:uncharacterized protein LOC143365516 n=1 Tax=Halictus rubicundus TaxID=77578 RepID=UPI0040361F70